MRHLIRLVFQQLLLVVLDSTAVQDIISSMDSEAIKAIKIDLERPEDIESIHWVNLMAFERRGEAEVVDQLRQNSSVFYSYVARVEAQVVGHILFTPAHIVQADDWTMAGLGLAPLAVLPEYQGFGIGSALCKEGLKRIASKNTPFVIVLGHPGYYPRFGFMKASNFGIRCSYPDVPEDSFMIRIFDHKKMTGVSGVAYYRPEFDSVT